MYHVVVYLTTLIHKASVIFQLGHLESLHKLAHTAQNSNGSAAEGEVEVLR